MPVASNRSTDILGAYDIRGRYPGDFSAAICDRLAEGFLQTARDGFVVGRDVRRASERLERSVVGRLRRSGRRVVELGVQPTPVIGFASQYLATTGLAFTPSHNAVGDAGIKAFRADGTSFASEWTRVRAALARAPLVGRSSGPMSMGRAPTQGRPTPASPVVQPYLAHVTRSMQTSRTIVVDGRGGATTQLAPLALRRLGGEVRELHPRFSPNFHELSPEPQRENVADLGRMVRSVGADLGVAFDGDGDRVVFVDEKGSWVEPEVIAMFLHRHLSPRGRPLIASADASQRCEEEVPTVRSRVGGRYVTAAMRRHSSSVGFEASSHYYLARWGPNSDGILAACVVCHLLDSARTSLTVLRRAFGPIVRDQRIVNFGTRAEARRSLQEVVRHASPRPEKGVDGFVFRSSEGSVLLRLSNTQPSIRIVLEPQRGSRLDDLRRAWEASIEGTKFPLRLSARARASGDGRTPSRNRDR